MMYAQLHREVCILLPELEIGNLDVQKEKKMQTPGVSIFLLSKHRMERDAAPSWWTVLPSKTRTTPT